MDNKLLSLLSQIEINLFVLKQQKNTIIEFLELLNIDAENRSLLLNFFNTIEHSLININTHVDVLKNEISTSSTTITLENLRTSSVKINVLDSTDGILLDKIFQPYETQDIDKSQARRIVLFPS